MRDKRFPPHEDVCEGILGWLAHGPATAEEIRDGLADTFGLSFELRHAGKEKSGKHIWTNLVAHGLRAFTLQEGAPMPTHELIDGQYHLTELGKQLAAKAVKGVPEITPDDILELVTRPGTNFI
jgi:hypothetical protein